MRISKAKARDCLKSQIRLQGESTMNITVEIKSVYGNRSIYPVCAKSKILADLAGTKTFTARALESIKSLGYQITVKQTEVTL